MNVRNLARTALTGALALAALAAFAQTQTLLVTDSAERSAFSGVHKIDVNTGKDLGYVGGLFLRHAQAIAIRAGSSTAVVADDDGIKTMDIDSGNFLSLVRSTAALGGWVKAMRFNPADGDLYAVVAPNPIMYKVVRLSRSTGDVKCVSGMRMTSYATPVALGFSTYGSVEVFSCANNRTYRDLYTPMLGTISSTSNVGTSVGRFRSSNDELVSYDNLGGKIWGAPAGGDKGVVIAPAGLGTFIGAAEGLNGQAFMLSHEGMVIGLRTFDTNGNVPKLVRTIWCPYFKNDNLNNVAVCIR